jgi:hypothetical protein
MHFGMQRDNSRKHSVIIDVVPVIAGFIGQNEFCQPFDTSTTDLSWHNGSQGASMVRTKIFAVHFVGKHDASIGIHDPVELDGCSIISVWLWKKLA